MMPEEDPVDEKAAWEATCEQREKKHSSQSQPWPVLLLVSWPGQGQAATPARESLYRVPPSCLVVLATHPWVPPIPALLLL